jgi:formamidopyrimidine-DNA glycosylase
MPELPEVEIVKRNLEQILKPPFHIQRWNFYRPDLRFKIPKKKLEQLIGQPVLSVQRRAKYILFEFEKTILISHLGMTGNWRAEKLHWPVRKHDHLAFQFSQDLFLVYEDPRRVGFVEVCLKKDLAKRFQNVGFEPLDENLDFTEVSRSFKKLKSPIKTALMNQKLVVGIGNIYASEILFKAKISPLKLCSRLNPQQYFEIWKWAKVILSEAINKGGSTIENYRDSLGNEGSYQNFFSVYGREGEACPVCSSKIKSCVQAGRTTFWCSTCQ